MKKLQKERKKETLHHLNRIEGQLKTLRTYIEDGKSCAEISSLSTSVTKSFDTLRVRTLEGFIINEIADRKLTEKKQKQLQELLDLFKK